MKTLKKTIRAAASVYQIATNRAFPVTMKYLGMLFLSLVFINPYVHLVMCFEGAPTPETYDQSSVTIGLLAGVMCAFTSLLVVWAVKTFVMAWRIA